MLVIVTGTALTNWQKKDGAGKPVGEPKTFGKLHTVGSKAMHGQGERGCSVQTFDAEPKVIDEINRQPYPGIYDLDIELQTFGDNTRVKIVGATFKGALGQVADLTDRGLVGRQAAAK